MKRFLIITLVTSLVLVATLCSASATRLYSVAPIAMLGPHKAVTAYLVVPSRCCDTCENLIGVRLGSSDYLLVAYNHPDSGPRIGVWLGQVVSRNESWSEELRGWNARAGERHTVVIRHEGGYIAFYLDGRNIYNVGNAHNGIATVVGRGVNVPPNISNFVRHSPSSNSSNLELLLLGVGIVLAIIIVVIRR